MMAPRDRFFAVMENRPADRLPFFPDITDWYIARRTPRGERQPFATGQMIFDDDPIHRRQVAMPERFRDFTLLDFYREFDWGCPIHAYEAIVAERDAIAVHTEHDGQRRHQTIETPEGALHTIWGRAPHGSESIVRYPVQGPQDVAAVEFLAAHTRYRGDAQAVERILDALGDRGVIDVVIGRTPFGLLVQELMGYQAVAYALADEPRAIDRLMEALSPGFCERVRIAAELPGRIAIISDHADEHLISPRQFQQFCLPHYREAQQTLHAAGKLVSTHLDGNIRGLLPLLPEAGFDLLDGCTPAPMGNYEPEDLAAVLGPRLKAYCGVPSALFCTNVPTDEILAYGRRIAEGLAPNVILNVGDVLPPDGDIEQVIALGEAARERPGRITPA
jgi:uroporphyrinogen-III decarboxylase